MGLSIEREENARFGERRVNERKCRLLLDLIQQRHRAWRDPPRSPLAPPP
jgi:hypothetical protein